MAVILFILSVVNDMQNKDKNKVCLGKLQCDNKPLYYFLNVFLFYFGLGF